VNPLSIVYLSHGPLPTGGFAHESFLAKTLQQELQPSTLRITRKWRFFKGIAQLYLLCWGVIQSNADINIVVGRLGVSAIIRNLFSKRKVIVVLHHFDSRYFGSHLLKVYYYLLIKLVRHLPKERFAIVGVSPFWIHFFENEVQHRIPVIHFPNVFEVAQYKRYQTTGKSRYICLGQWSSKNHPDIFALASRLHGAGFKCYFASLHPVKLADTLHPFEVIHEDFESYLARLGSAYCSVAFPFVKEGWNRVAHESILVGTNLVAYPIGGLADLANESGCTTFSTIDEAFSTIVSGKFNKANPAFVHRYEATTASNWIKPLAAFCVGGA
jgi:hypothetical protein